MHTDPDHVNPCQLRAHARNNRRHAHPKDDSADKDNQSGFACNLSLRDCPWSGLVGPLSERMKVIKLMHLDESLASKWSLSVTVTATDLMAEQPGSAR